MKKLFLLLILISAPLICMEQEGNFVKKSPSCENTEKHELIFGSPINDFFKTAQTFPKGSYTYIDAKWMNPDFVKKLKKLVTEKEFTVSLHLGNAAKKFATELIKAGMQVTILPDLHAKRYMLVSKNPLKKETTDNKTINPFESIVWHGSANACSLPHDETVLKSSNNKELFLENLSDHQFTETLTSTRNKNKRPILEITPKKITLVNTKKIKTNESKAKRILNFNKSTNNDDYLGLSSMTFNDEHCTAAFESLSKTIPADEMEQKTVAIFHRDAMNNHDKLIRLEKTGVPVYIANVVGEDITHVPETIGKIIPKIMHAKTLVRILNGKPCLVISSGNLTDESGKEINRDLYLNQLELALKIREFHKKLIQSPHCLTYKKIRESCNGIPKELLLEAKREKKKLKLKKDES